MPRTLSSAVEKTRLSARGTAKENAASIAQLKLEYTTMRKELARLRRDAAVSDSPPAQARMLLERLDEFEDAMDAQESALIAMDKTDAVVPWKDAKRRLDLA